MPILWMIKLTLKRSIRSRASIIIFILLLLFLIVTPLTILNDGSIKGRVQINLIWTMGGSLLLLSFFSLFNTILNIRSDISERQIYTLEATPITRWQMMAGKLIAVFIMNLVLVSLTGVICYNFIWNEYKKIDSANTRAEEILANSPKDEASLIVKRDYHILTNEVLSARLKIEDFYDIEELAQNALIEYKKGGEVVEDEKSLKNAYLEFYGKQSFFTVQAKTKGIRPVIFKYPPPPKEGTLFYTFSYFLYSTNKMEDRIDGYWEIAAIYNNDEKKIIGTHEVDHISSVRHSIRFSTADLDNVKFLYFNFVNRTNHSVYGGMNEKFYLLIPYSNFETNLASALFLILMKLTLISFTGALAASFLSFNVSVFLCASFVFFCYLSEVMLKFLIVSKSRTPSAVSGATNLFVDTWNQLSAYIVNFFPDFGNISGKLLVEGEYIALQVISEEVLYNIICRGGLMLVAGLIIFHFVEVGKEIADD
jgi:hypothetical protein